MEFEAICINGLVGNFDQGKRKYRTKNLGNQNEVVNMTPSLPMIKHNDFWYSPTTPPSRIIPDAYQIFSPTMGLVTWVASLIRRKPVADIPKPFRRKS